MALRELHDTTGIVWMVFEVKPTSRSFSSVATRAELSSGWLCFQSDQGRRRLPGVPDCWETMSDGALLALLSSASDAPRSRRFSR
jgi:hypothetical protein